MCKLTMGTNLNFTYVVEGSFGFRRLHRVVILCGCLTKGFSLECKGTTLLFELACKRKEAVFSANKKLLFNVVQCRLSFKQV